MEAHNIIIIQGETERNNGVHYEIDPSHEPIGKGGTGVVRSGIMVDERTGLRRDVAIKFLYDDMPANILIRSQREASIRVLSENLVEMIGFVQINEQDAQGRTIIHSHVVSELLHGVMLLDILKGKTTDKDGNEVQTAREYRDLMLADRNQFAMKIVRNVLSGIQALHDNGYIHRDIDPSNIMITDRGKVKLIDLGIAKKIDTIQQSDEQHLTSTGQFIGKAAYAAPELVLGDLANQNETTDIYAIGIMLYLLVVGKLPFNGPLQEILHQQCNEKMPVQDIKDKGIRKIVKKATEKRQSDRYQSAAEFRVAMDALTRQMKPHVVKSVDQKISQQEEQAMSTVVSNISEKGTIVSDLPQSGTVVSDIPQSGTVVSDIPQSGTVVSSPSVTPVVKQSASSATKPQRNHILLYICIAIAVAAIIAVVALVFSGNSSSEGGGSVSQAEDVSTVISSEENTVEQPASVTSSEPKPESVSTPEVETTSTQEQVTTPVETPKATKPSEAKPLKQEKSVTSEAPTKPTTKSSNGMKLSYGTYTGPVKNGYPNGKGKLVYTTSRRINKYDSKGIVAQPGEYVEGLFVNGFLTVGKHYSASGELLNKISAGVAEGVYESK